MGGHRGFRWAFCETPQFKLSLTIVFSARITIIKTEVDSLLARLRAATDTRSPQIQGLLEGSGEGAASLSLLLKQPQRFWPPERLGP